MGAEIRRPAYCTALERYGVDFTLIQGASSVTVAGDGADSCTGASGVYTVVLSNLWQSVQSCTATVELDHDSIATSEVITLANELKADYNAHRVLTTGTVHGAADSTNSVTASDATTLATAYTLLNQIKAKYNAHRVLTAGSVHGAADSTNDADAADATTLATAITLANQLKAKYNAHRVLTAGAVHGAADSTNVVATADVVNATMPYVGIRSISPSAKSLVLVTKNPTTAADAAVKAGGKIHVHLAASRRAT